MKICTKCREEKPLRFFNTRKDSASGYRSHCKECHSITGRGKWFNDLEFRKRGKANSKKHAVKKNYNLTVEEYDKLLSKPCAICGSKSAVLDHDHMTGTVLEGLCIQCNTCIGNAKEDIGILLLAIDYIKKHKKKSKKECYEKDTI